MIGVLTGGFGRTELTDAGAELVVIGNGAPLFALGFREDMELDCPLLVDPDDCPLPTLDSTRLLARDALRESLKGD